MPRRHPDVPDDIVAAVRAPCLALPETREEQAWVGVRWRIRKKTFAHVLMIDEGWPPAYVRAAATEGPACVLTFRSWLVAVDRDRFTRAPYFLPGWWPDIVGMFLDRDSDWDEVGLLLAASYRVMAPETLARTVAPPPGREP